MGEEEWMDVAEYLGNSEAIIHQVQELEGVVNVLLTAYRKKRHTRWKDLQEQVRLVGEYGSVHRDDYINRLTDEFVAEYGTYDAKDYADGSSGVH